MIKSLDGFVLYINKYIISNIRERGKNHVYMYNL